MYWQSRKSRTQSLSHHHRYHHHHHHHHHHCHHKHHQSTIITILTSGRSSRSTSRSSMGWMRRGDDCFGSRGRPSAPSCSASPVCIVIHHHQHQHQHQHYHHQHHHHCTFTLAGGCGRCRLLPLPPAGSSTIIKCQRNSGRFKNCPNGRKINTFE